MAEKHSSRTGSSTTADERPVASSQATLTANWGTPNRKLIVPSSGSITQRSSPSPGRATLLAEDRVIRAAIGEHASDRRLGGEIGLGHEIGRRALGADAVLAVAEARAQLVGCRSRGLARDVEQLELQGGLAHRPRCTRSRPGYRRSPGHRMRDRRRDCATIEARPQALGRASDARPQAPLHDDRDRIADAPWDDPRWMSATDTVAALANFEGRGAGTNAERRAAVWLASELHFGRREATVETFWCRPNWALAHAWHAALAVAGSLLTVASPAVGGAVILVALASLVVDGLTGTSLGRRLSPEHASQNVVSRSPAGAPVTLVITANYDAGRMGLVYRPALRRSATRLRALSGGRAPGWLAWVLIACIWLLVMAILRDRGTTGAVLDVAQLIPTAALVVAAGLLLELASSPFGPGAGDNASGVAVAIALARALDVTPPRQLGVEVVLQGAGDGAMIGLTRYLRARRSELRGAGTIVLGIGACGGGQRRWWTGDGSLIPLRYLRRLSGLAQDAIGPGTELGAAPYRGRGVSPAFPARFAGLPAIAIGCLERRGLVPRSHEPSDIAQALDRGAVDGLLELALTLVDAIDADLGRGAASGTAASSRTAA